jgi:predicted transcriptional regulator
MVKLTDEQIQALEHCDGEPLSFELPGSDRRFVLVEQSTYEKAVAALEYQRNVELIREGIRDLEAGRTRPLDEAMDDIRTMLLQRKANEALR